MARDLRIDSLKGFLIILVLLGHVIVAVDNLNVINHAVMGLIYVFHMPLFILISGYVTKNPAEQTPRQMWSRVGNIFITLVIFQLITIFRAYVDHGLTFTMIKLTFPYGILWYLMCLIYWRIMLYYTPKWLLNRPVLNLAIALLISILCGLSHLYNFFAIQRGLNFYFFFLLGYYFKQGAVNTKWWNFNVLHIAVAVILLPIIFWLFPRCGNIMNGADHYTMVDIPQKVMILSCSLAMCLLVFNKMPEVKMLTHIGKDSLFYYLYHIHIIRLCLGPLLREYSMPRTLPFVILYTLAILGIVYLMSKIKFFRWLLQPIKFKTS